MACGHRRMLEGQGGNPRARPQTVRKLGKPLARYVLSLRGWGVGRIADSSNQAVFCGEEAGQDL